MNYSLVAIITIIIIIIAYFALSTKPAEGLQSSCEGGVCKKPISITKPKKVKTD